MLLFASFHNLRKRSRLLLAQSTDTKINFLKEPHDGHECVTSIRLEPETIHFK